MEVPFVCRMTFWLIMVIGPDEWLTKSDDREAGVRFVNHEYDYRQSLTTQSPVNN